MAERPEHGTHMRTDKVVDPGLLPQTRNELQVWVREHLHLSVGLETSLLAAIDAVFTRHERLWQESKHEAIQALSAGFADKMARVTTELSAQGRDGQQHLALFRSTSWPTSRTNRTATRRRS